MHLSWKSPKALKSRCNENCGAGRERTKLDVFPLGGGVGARVSGELVEIRGARSCTCLALTLQIKSEGWRGEGGRQPYNETKVWDPTV